MKDKLISLNIMEKILSFFTIKNIEYNVTLSEEYEYSIFGHIYDDIKVKILNIINLRKISSIRVQISGKPRQKHVFPTDKPSMKIPIEDLDINVVGRFYAQCILNNTYNNNEYYYGTFPALLIITKNEIQVYPYGEIYIEPDIFYINIFLFN